MRGCGAELHAYQIRKMIGLAVVIMRNLTPESSFETIFEQLDCIWTNASSRLTIKKWKDSHEELSLNGFSEEAEDFKMTNIYPHIAVTEHKDGGVALWLHSLNYRNFPDLRADNSSTSGDGTGNDEGTVFKHGEVIS